MAEIARNVIAAFEGGQENRRRRTQQTALDDAGRLYGSGQYDQAENALVAAGMPEVAGSYSALAEARRGRANRTRVAGAMTALDPNATPDARLQAGAGAALEAGDVDQWAVLQQAASQMSAQQRQVAGERAQWIGSAAASLLDVPMEQRAAQAQQLLAASPYASDASLAAMLDDAPELNDEALNAAAQSSMSAAEILGMRRQESQFNRSLAVQERSYQRSMNPDATPLSNSDRRGVANQYNQAITGAMENLGILRPSLSYARLAVTNNGDTTSIDGVNSRSSDVALLRAAARAQTGPGVLTESEVFSTLSPSLQNDLNRNVAYLDIGRNGITSEDRMALAQFVMQSARNTQRDAWDLYENVNADWGARPNAPTFEPPRLPHPEDEGRLQSAERGGASVGQEYVANGGRTYRLLAPGSWELSRMGGERDMNQPQLVDPGRGATAPAPTRQPPQAGAVINGFRFRGGDPNNRANWTAVASEQPGRYEGR